MEMQTNGVYFEGKKVIVDCFLCGQESLHIENTSPIVQWIITDKGEIPVLAFLCGTCDKRQRQTQPDQQPGRCKADHWLYVKYQDGTTKIELSPLSGHIEYLPYPKPLGGLYL